jgi:hypothetical protein
VALDVVIEVEQVEAERVSLKSDTEEVIM